MTTADFLTPPDISAFGQPRTPPAPTYNQVLSRLVDANPGYVKVVSEDPFIDVKWRNVGPHTNDGNFGRPARIEQIGFRSGEILVNGEPFQPTSQADRCGVLATVGLSNAEIGKQLYIAEDTVKTHLRAVFRHADVQERAALASVFFRTKYFQILKPCAELKLTDAELPVVECLSEGMSNKEIGPELNISPLTVKSHLARIMRKNNVYGRESLVMCGLLSGQIDYSA